MQKIEHKPPSPASQGQPADLTAVLKRARFALIRFVGLDFILSGLLGMSLSLCLIMAVTLLIGLPFSAPVQGWLVLMAGAAALWTYRGILVWRPLLAPLHVAGWIERAAQRHGYDLGDRVRSAIELMAEDKSNRILGRSQQLSKAHQEQTAQLVLKSGALDSLMLVGLEKMWRQLCVLGTLFFIFGFMTVTHVSVMVDTWAWLNGEIERTAEWARPQIFRVPIVTDIDLELTFPTHMKRDAEELKGTTGDILAPLGTQVVLRGRADRLVKEAFMVIGEEKIPFAVSKGRSLKGKFEITKSGNYHFMLVTPQGDVEIDPVGHQIRLVPDDPPMIDLLFPAEDMTVEVDDEIPLQFEASDDYGLMEIRLVARVQGRRGKPFIKVLQNVPGELRRFSGRAQLALPEMAIQPGDVISIYLEATDNNKIADAQVGRSITRVLTVFSEVKHHRELLKKYEKLLWELVDALAQELENELPVLASMSTIGMEKKEIAKHSEITQQEAELTKTMKSLMVESRLDRYDIAALTQALSNAFNDLDRGVKTKKRTLDRIGSNHQLDKRSTVAAWGLLVSQNRIVTQSFEKHVLYFEDLINTQRLNEAHQLASELQKTQDALKQLLANYKEAPSDASREAILSQIQRLKEQLRDLYQRMAELKQDAPDEYLNQEAFQSENMMAEAQDLDALLEEGKMEDVVAALEKMIEQTQKMMEGIEKSQEEYGGEEYAALKKEMGDFEDLLNTMVEEQQNLGGQTEEIYQEALERAKKQAANKIKKVLNELVQKTKSALGATHRIPQEALNSLEKEELGKVTQRLMDLLLALQERYLEEGLEEASGAERALAMLEQSLSLRSQNAPMGLDQETEAAAQASQQSYESVQEVREALEKLIPDLKQSLNQNEKQKMKSMSQKQSAMNDGIKRLRQMMQKMNQQVPLFGEEHQGQLNQAGRSSRQAGYDLNGQKLKEARDQQRQAQNALEGLQESMDKMKQQSGGKGMPMPLPRPGSQQNKPGGQDDGRHHEHERIKLPDGKDFQVPEEHRKAILDAMREKAPEDWSKQVRDYYEELVR